MIEIWSLKNCPKCEEAKKICKEKNIEYNEFMIEDLQEGEIINPQVMLWFAEQNFVAPLIVKEDKVITINNL